MHGSNIFKSLLPPNNQSHSDSSLHERNNLLYEQNLFCSKSNTNPIQFCLTGNYDVVMQQSASNNQHCNFTCVNYQYLEQHCPPQVDRDTAHNKQSVSQTLAASHLSSLWLVSSLPSLSLSSYQEWTGKSRQESEKERKWELQNVYGCRGADYKRQVQYVITAVCPPRSFSSKWLVSWYVKTLIILTIKLVILLPTLLRQQQDTGQLHVLPTFGLWKVCKEYSWEIMMRFFFHIF